MRRAKEIAEEAILKTYYHNQKIKLCDDGTVYVSFRSTQLYEIFYWVISEGHRVKVLNPPKTDPSKPGIFAQRKANRFFGMDNLTVNYLLTKSIETHKSPEEIIGDLVRKEIALVH